VLEGFLDKATAAEHWKTFDRPTRKAVTAFFLWQAVFDQKKHTALFNRLRDLLSLLPSIIRHVMVVSLADCCGGPTADHERLAPGDGTLPLERIMEALVDLGFDGDVEFEFVAEPVDPPRQGSADASLAAGYHEALKKARKAARRYGCLPLPAFGKLPAPAPGR